MNEHVQVVIEGLLEDLVVAEAAAKNLPTAALLVHLAEVAPKLGGGLEVQVALEACQAVLLTVLLQVELELGLGQELLVAQVAFVVDLVVVDDQVIEDEVKVAIQDGLGVITNHAKTHDCSDC